MQTIKIPCNPWSRPHASRLRPAIPAVAWAVIAGIGLGIGIGTGIPAAAATPTTPEDRASVFYRDVAGQEDSEYHGQQNPLQPTPVNRRDGQSLFEEHCVPCHGFNGMGPTQETAEQLHDFPPPPLLRSAAAIYPVDQDAYLLWTISEGGAQFGRPMPTFKHVLSRNDIWKIVVYLDSIRVTGNKIGTGLDPVQVRPR